MTDDAIRTIRNFVILTVVRVAAIAVVLVVTAGLVIPWLINAHNTLYVVIAVVVAVLATVFTIVAIMQLALDFRRFPDKFHAANGGSK